MQHWYKELKKTSVLAFPIVLSQVSQHLIQVIDSAMIGRVGVVPLAGAAFASSVFIVPLVFCFGLTVATSILTSTAFGAGDMKRANHVLRVGLVLTSVVGAVLAIAMSYGIDMLGFFGQPIEVLEEAKPYFSLLMWSIVPALIFSCFKNYAEALNRPWMPLTVLLIMLVSNVIFNWIFIFGHFGIPAMGLIGAGWGTLFARSLSAILILLVIVFGKNWSFRIRTMDWFRIAKKDVWEYISLGVPSGLQIVFEVSAFTMAAIMMGWIGEVTLAAHQIAINVAGTTFMVTLGVSFATSVRIGQAYGRKDYVAVRRSGAVGWSVNAVFMSVCMLVLIAIRDLVPTWFVTDSAVIELASILLVIAAFFQVVDGIQVSMIASLRGIRDIKVPTFLVMFIYYGVCLPLAYVLGFVLDWQGRGIWTGLAVGLALSALILTLRFHFRSKSLILNTTAKTTCFR